MAELPARVDFEYAYFLVQAPATDPVTEAIVRAGVRGKIEENNELAKQITGPASTRSAAGPPGTGT